MLPRALVGRIISDLCFLPDNVFSIGCICEMFTSYLKSVLIDICLQVLTKRFSPNIIIYKLTENKQYSDQNL